ncbi:MAG: flippase-like domain-containing protein [Candidatus Dadabacteria bacterium]|nr:flippase-like domain-containing protein [Candidatus Dadabacteria bacterium]
MSKRKWTILRFAIAIAIIIFLFTKINIPDVINSALSAKLHYVTPAIILTLLAWYVASYRLKFFSNMQGLAISMFQAFEINVSTLFYGLFLPGGNLTGGVIKFYKLSRKDNKLSEALVALTLDRVFATLALCILGLFFWMLSIPEDSNLLVLSMVIILLGLAGFCIFVFFDRDHRVIKWLMSLVNKVYVSPKLNRFIQSLSGLGRIPLRSLILMITISIASQLLNVLVFFLLLKSIDLDVSFVSIGWIRSVVVLVTMIPISISGMGLREGAFILLLGAFGVSVLHIQL